MAGRRKPSTSIHLNFRRRKGSSIWNVVFRINRVPFHLSTGETELQKAHVMGARIYLDNVAKGTTGQIDTFKEVEDAYWLWHAAPRTSNSDTRPKRATAINYLHCLNRLGTITGCKTVLELRAKAPTLDSKKLGMDEHKYVPLIRQAASVFNLRFLEWCKSRGIELVNPLWGYIPAVILQRAFEPPHPGIVAALVAAAKRDLRDGDRTNEYRLFLLALGCGARSQDCCHVRWRDVTPRSIVVESTSDHPGKTKKSRQIPVSPTLIAELNTFRGAASDYVIEDLRPATRPAEDGGEPERRGIRIERRLCKWLRQNGVNEAHPTHWLRKVFGSKNTDDHGIFVASKWLGHSSVVVTERTYAGVPAGKFAAVI